MTWRLIKIEDTSDWPADGKLRQRGLRTWSHYAYDDEARTFCCEITPSRCLWYIGLTWDLAEGALPLADDENEQWFDFVMERPDSDVHYRHCSAADRLPFEDVTRHVDEDLLAEHATCGKDCNCEIKIADSIREWAVGGEIS